MPAGLNPITPSRTRDYPREKSNQAMTSQSITLPDRRLLAKSLARAVLRDTLHWTPEPESNTLTAQTPNCTLRLSRSQGNTVLQTDGTIRATLCSQDHPELETAMDDALRLSELRRQSLHARARELWFSAPPVEPHEDPTGELLLLLALTHATRAHHLTWTEQHQDGFTILAAKDAEFNYRLAVNPTQIPGQKAAATFSATGQDGRIIALVTERVVNGAPTYPDPVVNLLGAIGMANREKCRELTAQLGHESPPKELELLLIYLA